MNSEYGWYGQNGLEACSCDTTFLNTSFYILTFPMLQISRDVYRKASSTVHRPGVDCCWECSRCACARFCRERREASCYYPSWNHSLTICYPEMLVVFSLCEVAAPLKGWKISNIWEQSQWIKILFRKKLRADWSQGELAIIWCRMFRLPICYPKILRLRYTEL